MKNLFVALLLAALMPFAVSAASDCNGYNTVNCQKQGGSSWVVGGDLNVMTGGDLTVESGGDLVLESGSTVDSSGIAFTTVPSGNPLAKAFYQQFTLASVNAGTPLIASVDGKTIHIVGGALSLMASGTSGGGTSIILKCSGGTNIATFPIALMVDLVPFGPFSSTVVTKAAGLTKPCGAGEAVMISAVGTHTTMSALFANGMYIYK